MAQVQAYAAGGEVASGFQLNNYVSTGAAYIPTLANASVGWYRIAKIDRTSAPYITLSVMCSGSYSSGTPTSFVILATLPTYDSNTRLRVRQLIGSVGANYTQIRFSQDTNGFYIEMYLANGATGSRGQEYFYMTVVGGKLTTYAPTAPIDTEPTTIIATFPLETDDFTYSGAYKFNLAPVVTGGAGWYRLADMTNAVASVASAYMHTVGTIYYTGWYSGFKPSKGVFSFSYDGGSTYGNIVQTSGVASTAPTQIRLVTGASGHLYVEMYFPTITASSSWHEIAVRALAVGNLTYMNPTLISELGENETVRATMTIKTIASGAVTTTT